MAQVFRWLGVIALVAWLTGCGNDASPDKSSSDARVDQGEQQVLHVYNWADYVAPSTISAFEARTGIKVSYDVFDSADMLATKLLTGGSGYDVVMPNGGTTYRLGQAGILLKLDKSRLKNLGNLDSQIIQIVAANDPCN